MENVQVRQIVVVQPTTFLSKSVGPPPPPGPSLPSTLLEEGSGLLERAERASRADVG